MKTYFRYLIFSAAGFASLSHALITEEQALADPALDRSFAQEQFAEGNFEKALSAIERVIIESPLDLSARFFRINLMVVLNRGAEVRDELETILSLSLPEADLQRARDLLQTIDRKNAKFNGRVAFRTGIEFDDNVNSWSNLEQDLSGVISERSDDKLGETSQLDDIALQTSLSFSGSYALSADKTTLAKFSLFGQFKPYQDTKYKKATTTSASLILSQRVDSLTAEIGASFAKVDKVNYTNDVDGVRTTLNTNSAITSSFVNLNYRLNPKVTLNYRYTDGEQDNSGFDEGAADAFDIDTSSHAATVLIPLANKMLAQLGYTYSEARNVDQRDGASAARKNTDSDTDTVSVALFKTLANSDSIIWRSKYGTSETLYTPTTESTKRRTRTLTSSVEYKANLKRFKPELEGWSVGGKLQNSHADSNIMDSKKNSNTASLYIERKWDIWK